MSLQFCIDTDPDLEATTFELVALYDQRVSQTAWDANELAIAADIALAEANGEALKMQINDLNKQLLRLQLILKELGA